MAEKNVAFNFKKSAAFFGAFALLVVIVATFQNCAKFELSSDSLNSTSSVDDVYGFLPAKSSGLRPLTVREYAQSVKLLLGETSGTAYQSLPEETFSPFDNFIENSEMSAAKVQGFEAAARAITTAFLADNARLARYLPCIPTSNLDGNCILRIVSQIGKRAFRRPLTEEEQNQFVSSFTTFANRGNSYQAGLGVFLNVILQHPMFLYRWEVGTPSDDDSGSYRLNDYELASRLSFTLFGLPPDDQLLAEAQSKSLTNPAKYEAIVDRMLNDPRAIDHIDFFHASWLGYQAMGSLSPLTKAMREESKALIKKIVVDEKRPWTDIFTSQETYLSPELAQHYEIPGPANGSAWMAYPDRTRGGLLSHATFLSVGAKFGDTSPIQRGYHIRKQLFCEKIAPPPPGIDVDNPPKDDVIASPCKEANHQGTTLRSGTSCVSCHSRMDPVGFGLERFSASGKFRTSEPSLPECSISGRGSVAPYGAFNGPAELGEIVVRSGRVEGCLVERWIQLSTGIEVQEEQGALTAKYLHTYNETKGLLDLIRAFVLNADFQHRKSMESSK